MARLLVVEDERKLLRSLQRGLQTQGFELTVAADGVEGLRLALAETFDCILLDVMLPGKSGLEVLAELRRAGKTVPVLMLTARDAIEDRVIGLEGGADDYLVKPFALAELVARIRVLLRRGRNDRETVLCIADLEMDLVERRVQRAETRIDLTPREFDLLAYLLRHKESIVTREMLGRDVWEENDYALTNVIDVCINSLRRKIERSGQPALIHTYRGLGYSLREEPCP
jgi:DNA-binding response OmpR family regulator